MRKLTLILFVINLFTNISFSQEKRFEEVYQECINSKFLDNGKKLKEYIIGFEQHLISLKILNNKKPKSYLALLKSLTEGKKYPSEYSYSYLDSINKLKIKILPSNSECLEQAMKHRSYANHYLRFYDEKQEKIMQNLRDFNLLEVLKITYSKMKESDYELDFYKHKLFMILYTINELDEFEDDELPNVENPLIISINSKGNIFNENKEVSPKKLTDLIEKYIKNNENNNLILIKTDRNLNYGKYLNIIEYVDKAVYLYKNSKANSIFGINYKTLNKDQKRKIDIKYEVNLRDEIIN